MAGMMYWLEGPIHHASHDITDLLYVQTLWSSRMLLTMCHITDLLQKSFLAIDGCHFKNSKITWKNQSQHWAIPFNKVTPLLRKNLSIFPSRHNLWVKMGQDIVNFRVFLCSDIIKLGQNTVQTNFVSSTGRFQFSWPTTRQISF